MPRRLLSAMVLAAIMMLPATGPISAAGRDPGQAVTPGAIPVA